LQTNFAHINKGVKFDATLASASRSNNGLSKEKEGSFEFFGFEANFGSHHDEQN